VSTTGPTEPSGDADDSHKPTADNLRTLHTADLLQGAREVLIEHRGEIYRLRLTRNDKLILQK